LPVTSAGNFSVPSLLQPSRTVTICFDLLARITFVRQCITGPEIIEESNLINIKYVLRLASVNYFGQFFIFQSITISGFTMGLSPNRALYEGKSENKVPYFIATK
jgi:hypothetical protein